MRNLIAGIVIVAASIFPVHAAVAEYRVAIVDMNRVLNESKEAQAERKKLDSLSEGAKKKLDTKRTALKQLEEKLRAAKVAADSKEAEQFRTQAKEYEQLLQESQEGIKKEFMRSNKEITEKAVKIVRTMAEKEGYDLVLDKGVGSRGPVLFANDAVDISDDVLEEINR